MRLWPRHRLSIGWRRRCGSLPGGKPAAVQDSFATGSSSQSGLACGEHGQLTAGEIERADLFRGHRPAPTSISPVLGSMGGLLAPAQASPDKRPASSDTHGKPAPPVSRIPGRCAGPRTRPRSRTTRSRALAAARAVTSSSISRVRSGRPRPLAAANGCPRSRSSRRRRRDAAGTAARM